MSWVTTTKKSELGNAGIIRNQRYRTEPWCRNTDAGLRQLTSGKNAEAGLTFLRQFDIPAFTYDFSISYSKNTTISCCPLTCKINHFWTFPYLQFGRALYLVSLSPPPPLAVWTCRVYPFFKCRNVGLSGMQSVRYWNKQKCRCRNQSSVSHFQEKEKRGETITINDNIKW